MLMYKPTIENDDTINEVLDQMNVEKNGYLVGRSKDQKLMWNRLQGETFQTRHLAQVGEASI